MPRARQASTILVVSMIRMAFALQVDQRLRAERDRLVEQRDVEIRHADVAREAVALGLGERAHGSFSGICGVRPVHQQQVDIVDAEVGEALVDRAREIGGAQVFVRDLGAEENVVARHAGRAHAFADAAFAAVFPRGVDVAIAELERGRDDLAANVGCRRRGSTCRARSRECSRHRRAMSELVSAWIVVCRMVSDRLRSRTG